VGSIGGSAKLLSPIPFPAALDKNIRSDRGGSCPDSLFQVLNVVNTKTIEDLLHIPPEISQEPGERSWYSDWLRAGRLSGRSSSSGWVKNFDFSKSSRPALGSTQPPIQWVPWAFSMKIKRQGRETDH
jgi:hypothetical protein